MFIKTADLSDTVITKGYTAKIVHTEQMTIAHVTIEAGHDLPEHHHVHEQVTNVLSGELEMTVGGETHLCTEGTVVTIPSNVPHSARALTDCFVVDVFQPARSDFKQ
ncbi:MAG: cupin domain-containing protein [Bacteroidota bacterium]